MDYLEYDYKSTNKELSFNNYDRFVWDFRLYKTYLFDLSLLQHDSGKNLQQRQQATSILQTQKLLFFLPYPITAATLIYCWRRNVFKTKLYDREAKMFIKLFCFYLSVRVFQKGLLKYQGDKLLSSL